MMSNRNDKPKWSVRAAQLAKRKAQKGTPEDRAARTLGRSHIGKITLKQYLLLVRLGMDGDIIKKWTKYHAAQEIGQRLGKN